MLSIFFPMWNEELYVERAVDAAKRVCDTMVTDGVIADYELLIVDDASTDRTPELADKLAAVDPHVRVIHHEHNRKLGGAIKTGFASARGDIILYSDADLPFDMEEVPRAIRLMREYEIDIVSAYRFDRTGEGYTRSIYTFFYNGLIRTMFGVKARDINFAFKLCRREVFEHIRLQSEGSFIDAELVIRATRLGYDILQFGVDYFPRTRGVSTLSRPGIIATILREMVQLRGDLEGHRAGRPQRLNAAGERAWRPIASRTSQSTSSRERSIPPPRPEHHQVAPRRGCRRGPGDRGRRWCRRWVRRRQPVRGTEHDGPRHDDVRSADRRDRAHDRPRAQDDAGPDARRGLVRQRRGDGAEPPQGAGLRSWSHRRPVRRADQGGDLGVREARDADAA